MNSTLTRALSGAVYVLLLIGATLYSDKGYSFLLLFGILLIFSVVEFCKLVHLKPILPLLIASILFILFNLDKSKTNKTTGILLLVATLLISIKALLFLFEKKVKHMDITSKYTFLIGYLILPLVIFTRIPFIDVNYNPVTEINPKIIISIFILIWSNDTFAYLVGRSFGKHKLFEKVSPKKTIEGFVGGLIFSIISGIILATAYIHENTFKWVIIAIIVCLFGTIGDLIESKFKRNANVKDSGNIMPGHGGFLDRLDSIIFASPFIYLFYQILYYVS